MDMAGLDLLTVRDCNVSEVAPFCEDGPTKDAFWRHRQ
jgi:hypothetical protein